MLRFITPQPLVGKIEESRLQKVELIVSRFRWAMAIFGIGFNLVSHGPYPSLRMATTLLFLVSCAVATIALRRSMSLRKIYALGIFVVACDAMLLSVATVTDLGRVELGLWGAGLMVTFEASVRWFLVGGLGAAVVMSFTSALGVWVRSRHLHLPFSPSAAAFRSVVMLVVGLAVGVIVQSLERARSALARRVRESEVVSKFALLAPELAEIDAIGAVAQLLHDELGFERVVVSIHEPEAHRLRPSAFAGFPGTDVTDVPEAHSWYRGIDVDDRRSLAVRCFSANRATIARVSDGEEAFGLVLPGDTVRAKLAVPLRAGGRTLGVLEVSSSDETAYDDDAAQVLESMASELAQVLEHARLGEMRRETITELKRLAEMKDDFIAIASHELRTPITALRGFARALTSPQVGPEQQRQAIEVINRQVDRLGLLIEDLLAVSLIDSGSHSPSIEPVAVDDMIREVVAEASVHASGHEVVVEIGGDPPEVMADRQYFRRVLVNLLSNALKYSPDSERVEITASVVGADAVIAVLDRGRGIPVEEQPRLFEKFMRVPSSNGPGGTGLGLYIVRGLVEAMEGKVGVDSVPGEGSRFWISLPLVVGPSSLDPSDATIEERSTSRSGSVAASHSHRDASGPTRPDHG